MIVDNFLNILEVMEVVGSTLVDSIIFTQL
jgi:hypothetical protein